MRVLLDECLPRRLKTELPDHEVRTAQEEGWAGLRNGELLRVAAVRFEVLLTVDAQWAHSFLLGDVAEITAAKAPLIMFESKQSFFDVMRDKLHWGARSDKGASKGDA